MNKKKKAPPKKKNGRPSKKAKVDLKVLAKLCELGQTDAKIAQTLGISERTLARYKKEKGFCQAFKKGHDARDKHVVTSLYERATGYKHPDVDIKVVAGRIVQTKFIKHYPPDPASMIFWLKNRKSEDWRDRIENEHKGNVTVIIRKFGDGEKPSGS